LPEIEAEDSGKRAGVEPSRGSIFEYPHLLLGVVCIFVYVGVEVMAGDAIGIYGKSEGMSIATAKYFGSITLGAMLLGYLTGVLCIPKVFSQGAGLRVSAVLGLIFSTLALFTTGYTAILFVALLGLANALMWPAIWPLAIDGLGRHIKTGAAMLVMGIAGGAVLPPIYAALKADPHIGNKLAFFYCVCPCYLYILYFSVAGYKRGRKYVLATA
jgi:MFS transporter, FHS family, L-fucose permease